MHTRGSVERFIRDTFLKYLQENNILYKINDKKGVGINIIIDKQTFMKHADTLLNKISELINDKWIYNAHIIAYDNIYVIKFVYATKSSPKLLQAN